MRKILLASLPLVTAAFLFAGCEAAQSAPDVVSAAQQHLNAIEAPASSSAVKLQGAAPAIPQDITFNAAGMTVVYNPGNNPGSCSVAAFSGVYQGSATTIFKDGAISMYVCPAKLTSGTPVETAVKLDIGGGHWEFSPGGTALVSYPTGF